MTSGPGRVVNHDPRSRDYAYPRSGPEHGLVSVRHVFSSQNLDQFYLSACVGFSGSNMLNCAKAARSRRAYNLLFADAVRPRNIGRYLDHEDGINNYSNSTAYDPFDWEYPPTDEGSSALGLMKFWHKNHIISGYDWCFTFDQFLAALQRQPVLVGTTWYEEMNEPNPATGLVESQFHTNVGGHEYLAVGIRYDRRWIRFENSWGEQWGDRGGFYMHFDDVAALLADNGDIAVPRFP